MKKAIDTKKIFTLPNALTFCRILMIPVFVWLYMVQNNYKAAAGMLLLSGLTDVLDGRIARRFHMVSDIGKILDPIADKLTQFVTVICLMSRFSNMIGIVVLLAVKECVMSLSGILMIRKTHNIYSANWHGKVTTLLLYIMMFLHVIWYDIPKAVSNCLFAVCLCSMALSMILYLIQNIEAIKAETVNK